MLIRQVSSQIGGTEIMSVFRQNATSGQEVQAAHGNELWLVWTPEHSYVLGQEPQTKEER